MLVAPKNPIHMWTFSLLVSQSSPNLFLHDKPPVYTLSYIKTWLSSRNPEIPTTTL